MDQTKWNATVPKRMFNPKVHARVKPPAPPLPAPNVILNRIP